MAGLFSLLLAVPFSIARGFVIMKLWQWFVLPVFVTAPPLHISAAIGIALLVSFLTYQFSFADAETELTTGEKLAVSCVFSTMQIVLALGIGYIVSLFM